MLVRFLAACALATLGCSGDTSPGGADDDVGSVDAVDDAEADATNPDPDPGPAPETDNGPEPQTDTVANPEPDADPPDVQIDRPPPPPEPTLVEAGVELPTLTVHEFSAEPATWAAPWGEEGVLAIVDGGLVEIEAPGEDAVVVEPAPPAVLWQAITVNDVPLLLTSAGVYTIGGDGLVLSPLTAAFGDAVPRSAAVVSGEASDEAWFVSETSMSLWRDGLLYPVSVDGASVEDAVIAWGAPVDSQPALWVAADEDVYSLVEADDGLVAWVEIFDLEVVDLAVDASGRLLAVGEGDVHVRAADGAWEWLRLPGDVTAVAAGPDASAWVGTEGELWLNVEDQWWSVVEAGYASMASDTAGRLVVAGPQGVSRLTIGDVPDPPPEIVTWTEDVAPLVEEKCSLCHGDGAYAHPMFTRQHWIDEIDDILFVVDSQAMPLPPNDPLTTDEIEIIAEWKNGGFEE